MTQNSPANEDLRVRRTRKMLQEAFIALTVEKGYASITVQDITERAMVNRSTFYRHYIDKCDLLGQYMNDVYDLISDEAFVEEKLAHSHTPSGLLNLLKHIQQYADFYRVMLGSQGDLGFIQDFRRNSEKRFRFLIANYGEKPDANSPPTEMRLNYVSYAGVGAIVWWLENNQPCTVEQLAKWIGQLTTTSAGIVIKPDVPT